VQDLGNQVHPKPNPDYEHSKSGNYGTKLQIGCAKLSDEAKTKRGD